MSTRLNVKANPDVLRWARSSIGISIQNAAKKIDVRENVLVTWEQEESNISVAKLRELGEVYKRPWAVFLLQHVPDDPPVPKDFRTIPVEGEQIKDVKYSTKTLLAIRKAVRIQELAAELQSQLEFDVGSKIRKVDLSHANAETLATKIREDLAISIAEQIKWKDPTEAFGRWAYAIEQKRVLLLQLKMNVKEARGFSIYGDQSKQHVIAINSTDAVAARNFSIFHEFAHLILNESGIKSIQNNEVHFGSNIGNIEKFCNHFAGAFLVPKQILLEDESIRHHSGYEWEERTLARLASKFKVSKEVVLRRLLILNRTDNDFYEMKRAEWKEKLLSFPKKSGGQRDMPTEAIRENGKTFTSIVLQGNSQGKLSYGDVADYLQVKVKHLPQIIDILGNSHALR